MADVQYFLPIFRIERQLPIPDDQNGAILFLLSGKDGLPTMDVYPGQMYDYNGRRLFCERVSRIDTNEYIERMSTEFDSVVVVLPCYSSNSDMTALKQLTAADGVCYELLLHDNSWAETQMLDEAKKKLEDQDLMGKCSGITSI